MNETQSNPSSPVAVVPEKQQQSKKGKKLAKGTALDVTQPTRDRSESAMTDYSADDKVSIAGSASSSVDLESIHPIVDSPIEDNKN
jgi:beta-mannanase